MPWAWPINNKVVTHGGLSAVVRTVSEYLLAARVNVQDGIEPPAILFIANEFLSPCVTHVRGRLGVV